MSLRNHPTVQESTVVGSLRNVRVRLTSALRESRLVGRPITAVARLLERRTSTDEAERSAVTNSRLLGAVRRTTAVVGNAAEWSLAVGVVRGIRHLVESSWLYRWLTAEPGSATVIIDLQDTVTVRPWLRLFQRVLQLLLPAAVSSVLIKTGRRLYRAVVSRPIQIAGLLIAILAVGFLVPAAASDEPSIVLVVSALALAGLAAVASRITLSWDELQETSSHQLLASVFEPPEPRESQEVAASGDHESTATANTETESDAERDQ